MSEAKEDTLKYRLTSRNLLALESIAPEDLYQVLESDAKIIKQITMKCPFNHRVFIRDISLVPQGSEEDEAFAHHQKLWLNVRRGTCLIDLVDKEGYLVESFMARKGINKFFDLALSYVKATTRKDFWTELKTSKFMSFNSGILKQMILGEAFYLLNAKGLQVEVVKTLKASGENAQISFNQKTNSWVIGSKNVTLLAGSPSEVDKYKGHRYFFAKLIAKQWFEIVERIEYQTGVQGLDDLKLTLSSATLVGEYVGNPRHQHLIKYPRETIVFFAVTDNVSNSSRPCWLPEDAGNLFEMFDLDCVPAESMGTCTTYDHLCDLLQREFISTTSSSLAEEEEGCVFYLVQRSDRGRLDKVISICKTKTLEYRILRKLREKLRRMILSRQKQDWKSFKATLAREINALYVPLKPHLDYLPNSIPNYLALAQTAFNFVTTSKEEGKKARRLLLNEYVTFLEEVLKRHNYKIDLNMKSCFLQA